MASLRATLNKESRNGEAILDATVSAIRRSMEAGLRIVFIIGALAMLLTFLTICSIPQISIDKAVEEKKTGNSPGGFWPRNAQNTRKMMRWVWCVLVGFREAAWPVSGEFLSQAGRRIRFLSTPAP